MRLAIDVTSGVNQAAGVGRATRETVTALAAADPSLRLTLFYGRESTSVAAAGERWLTELQARHPTVRRRRLPLSPRWTTRLWLRLRLPLPAELVTGPIDCLLAPDFVAPPTMRARTVVTIHDLSYLVFPQYADPGLQRYLATAVPPSLRRAAHVVAVSAATRQDVIDRLGIAPERVSVVHNGVDSRFRRAAPSAIAEVRQRHRLPERFVLTLGTIEPRKNHVTLLAAFAQLAAAEPALTLVIGGRSGWLDAPIYTAVERLGLTERVRFLGPVPDDDLPALYSAATVFAFPSWYEGFGLPPLEAMACGTPTLASTSSSLPEVCGDAAVLVEPGDAAAMATGLERLLTDAALRARLVEGGPRQAARFSWATTAQRLIEVLRRLG